MKVLLLNPFLMVYPDDPSGINPPLGLVYLASFLESKNIQVGILDIAAEGVEQKIKIGNKIRCGLSEKEIKERIKSFSPKIVGISCQSTLHAKDAHEIARLTKEVDKNIWVVMGGAHPSAVPEDVLKDKNIDLVVRGEGEITFWELVKNYPKINNWSEIKGISWRKNNKIIHNTPREYIKDLDFLPFPARHLLPMETYFREAREGISYSLKNRVVTMISSRGCPGNCIYCAVRTVWGRCWRGRSPENVVDEIELLIRDYGAEEVHFLDDSISVDKKRLEGICDKIIQRGLKIKWTTPNGIAVWLLDKDLLLKMKKSGCYRLTFGLESGNKEILSEFIGKNYDYKRVREIIRFASKIGLWTIGTFIIGFPYETREQIEDTISFAILTDLDFATFYIANPFPGTRMYEIYKKEKLLPGEGAYQIVRGCKSKNFSHQELISLQSDAFTRFLRSRFARPGLMARKLNSFQNWPYFLKLGRSLGKFVISQSFVKTKGIAALWER